MNQKIVISQRVEKSMSEELDCDYCQRTFPSDKDGVTEKTVHMILNHADKMTEEEMDKGLCFDFTKKDFETEKKMRDMMR